MRSRARWLLAAFWIIPALVATLGLRLVPSALNPGLSTAAILATQLAVWLAWGLWSLVVLAVGDRFPFERGKIGRAIAVHVPLGVVVVLAQIGVTALVARVSGLGPPRELSSTLLIGLRQYGDLYTVVFCGIVAAQQALRWHSALREQALRAAQLDQDLAQAQLNALQAQLRPHFLFNALNSVVTLIGKDPPAARQMVVELADLLRATLRAGERQEIGLRQELEITARYVAIEQVRFSDRLVVEWSVPDGLNAIVPAFALQPLVENAIVHGIGSRSGPARIAIAVVREGDALLVQVSDDGPGPGGVPSRADGGVGLSNLRARLFRLYGDAASVTLRPSGTGGTTAKIELPYRSAE